MYFPKVLADTATNMVRMDTDIQTLVTLSGMISNIQLRVRDIGEIATMVHAQIHLTWPDYPVACLEWSTKRRVLRPLTVVGIKFLEICHTSIPFIQTLGIALATNTMTHNHDPLRTAARSLCIRNAIIRTCHIHIM
jgi:hypothetical protein